MASSWKPSILSLVLLLVILMLIAQVTLAGRPTPTTSTNELKQTQSTLPKKKQTEAYSDMKQTGAINASSRGQTETSLDKKQTECQDHEGTVLIPGVGRYMIGSQPSVPTVGRTFLGDSVPAAMNGRYLPGIDDTFVPNPGYEVPNPFHGSVP